MKRRVSGSENGDTKTKLLVKTKQPTKSGSHYHIEFVTLDSNQLRRPRAASEQRNYKGSQTIKKPRVQ